MMTSHLYVKQRSMKIITLEIQTGKEEKNHI